MAKASRWTPPPKLTCTGCKTAQSAEWCALDPAGLERINTAKATRRYAAGESIYLQGDPCQGVFCIESGLVAVRVSDPDGNSKMLRTVDAGETLGTADFFAGRGYRASAHSVKEAIVCHVPGDVLRSALLAHPALSLEFLAHGAQDLERANTAALQRAIYPVRMRLARLIVEFKDKHGTSSDDGAIALELPVSWQEAADLLDARPETVSRSVQAMVHDGVFITTGRKVVIPDLDRLLDELEAPPE
ncbi:MAG TPA: Crp/Fnr family transcriptional regulator [bacterium]